MLSGISGFVVWVIEVYLSMLDGQLLLPWIIDDDGAATVAPQQADLGVISFTFICIMNLYLQSE